MCDNKTFWKNIQPFFREKRKITSKITLVDEDETVDDQLILEEFNQFFKNSTKNLNISENSYLIDKSELSDPVNKTISEYKSHHSMLLIKDKIRNSASFFSKKPFCLILKKSLKTSIQKKQVHLDIYHLKILEQVKKVVLKLLKLWQNCLIIPS